MIIRNHCSWFLCFCLLLLFYFHLTNAALENARFAFRIEFSAFQMVPWVFNIFKTCCPSFRVKVNLVLAPSTHPEISRMATSKGHNSFLWKYVSLPLYMGFDTTYPSIPSLYVVNLPSIAENLVSWSRPSFLLCRGPLEYPKLWFF